VSLSLQKYDRGQPALALTRSDASDDAFVRQHMAAGEAIVRADKYTQAPLSVGLQLLAAGGPVALVSLAATGSLLGALGIGAATMVGLGALMVLETSNRIVLTTNALVVQTSVLLNRYQLEYIQDARIEVLSPRKWLGLDICLFDPRSLLRKSEGLRFRYQEPGGRDCQVFIAVDGAGEYLGLLPASARRP
jgi:hypothetical protein